MPPAPPDPAASSPLPDEPAPQELRLRLATDALGVGVFEVVDGVPVWENDCVYEIFGRDRALGPLRREEFAERVLHPDDLPSLVAAFGSLDTQGGTLSLPCRIRRQDDGRWRWIEFTMHARALPDGGRRVVGVVSDVTEREEGLRRLRESEERYRTLFETMPAGVIVVDAQGRLRGANEAALALSGYTRDELVGMPLHALVIEPDAAQLQQRLREVLAQPGKRQYLSRYRRKDGRLLDVQVSVQAQTVDGEPGVLAVVADLTPQKEAERALRVQRTRLDIALETGRLGAWEWHVDDATASWSDGMYALTGLPMGSGSEPVQRFIDLMHEDDRERVQQGMARMLAGEAVRASEHRIRRPDGAIRWLSGHGRALHDDSGRLRTIVGVSADITERKLMELQLRDTARRKDEFLAMLSHELRNPLAPITTAVSALRRGVAPQQAAALHETIARQTRHLTHLVDDLLDATRIATGRIVLRPEPLWLREVAQAALDTLQPMLAARGQQVQLMHEGTQLQLQADPTRLTQVLVNLLHNASKFSPAGATIELHIDERPQTVRIEVIDHGRGVDADQLAQIFDLFVQGRGGDAAEGGLGIGLALVKGLVELHGGTVGAHSAGRGQGARFAVQLPRAMPGPR